MYAFHRTIEKVTLKFPIIIKEIKSPIQNRSLRLINERLKKVHDSGTGEGNGDSSILKTSSSKDHRLKRQKDDS